MFDRKNAIQRPSRSNYSSLSMIRGESIGADSFADIQILSIRNNEAKASQVPSASGGSGPRMSDDTLSPVHLPLKNSGVPPIQPGGNKGGEKCNTTLTEM